MASLYATELKPSDYYDVRKLTLNLSQFLANDFRFLTTET